jgi:hypothetical protein
MQVAEVYHVESRLPAAPDDECFEVIEITPAQQGNCIACATIESAPRPLAFEPGGCRPRLLIR